MPAEVVAVPRRGTAVFRAWLVRALGIGLLPLAAVGLGVSTLVATDLAQAPGGEAWAELAGYLLAGTIIVGVLGLVAMLDARTRLTGAFAMLAAMVLNPYTAALALLVLGLT
ncbi:hypothetical protein LG299_10680 [Microbacterium lacus]|uniref:hypothetical protein n=1 Tax=Microbacterium lacus TaxID=415217 RepID=UPI00384DB6F5